MMNNSLNKDAENRELHHADSQTSALSDNGIHMYNMKRPRRPLHDHRGLSTRRPRDRFVPNNGSTRRPVGETARAFRHGPIGRSDGRLSAQHTPLTEAVKQG